MADANWKPLRPFDIDRGELNGLSPQDIFTLGYELATIDLRVEHGVPIVHQPIHAANRKRIEKELKKRGVSYTLTWMEGDVSEEWMDLTVHSKKGEEECR